MRLGGIEITEGRKEFACVQCEEPIPAGEIHVSQTGYRVERKLRFRNRLHTRCCEDFFVARYERFRTAPKYNYKGRKEVLYKLNAADKAERHKMRAYYQRYLKGANEMLEANSPTDVDRLLKLGAKFMIKFDRPEWEGMKSEVVLGPYLGDYVKSAYPELYNKLLEAERRPRYVGAAIYACMEGLDMDKTLDELLEEVKVLLDWQGERLTETEVV